MDGCIFSFTSPPIGLGFKNSIAFTPSPFRITYHEMERGSLTNKIHIEKSFGGEVGSVNVLPIFPKIPLTNGIYHSKMV